MSSAEPCTNRPAEAMMAFDQRVQETVNELRAIEVGQKTAEGKLSQEDCDKKITAIFGGPGSVAATVNEPSTLQHPSAGRDRYDHLAGNGVFHLYTNAQGTEATVGVYTPRGFMGRPATGTVHNGPVDPSPARLITTTRDLHIGVGYRSLSYMPATRG